MPTRIKIAKSTEELDALFRSRHVALVEELGSQFPSPDGRLMDRFDAFPSTWNVVAAGGDDIVGGIRLCPAGSGGSPLDGLYDFGANVPSDAKAASLSRFHLLEEYQDSSLRLGFSMLYMATHLACQRDMTHLVCCTEPRVARLAQSIGFQQVSARFHHEVTGRELVPMVLDLRQLDLPSLTKAREPGLLEAFELVEWEYHRAGDTIIHAGSKGDAAYLIVDGEVIVSVERGSPSGRSTFELATLGPGQIFGELALLTMRRRTANVVAATEVDLMVLDREVFRDELMRRPDRLPLVLSQLADRLANADDLLTR